MFQQTIVAWKQGLCGRKSFNIKGEGMKICLLVELIMSLSRSNSTVERGFSLLTLLMPDRRLKLAHNTTEKLMIILMIININDKLWTPTEREEIMVKALQKYEDAKRTVRTFNKPSKKRLVIEKMMTMVPTVTMK